MNYCSQCGQKVSGSTDCCKSNKYIVILQRGWVFVGDFSQEGSECKLNNASCIRLWGTTKGLGELAIEGPLSGTKLDPTPEVTFHEMTVVAKIKCSGKWQ